jgi:hypothetical protein
VAGGWWLVAGGWWLVAGAWLLSSQFFLTHWIIEQNWRFNNYTPATSHQPPSSTSHQPPVTSHQSSLFQIFI